MTKHLPRNVLFGCVGFKVLYMFSACFESRGYVSFALNMNENKKEQKREIKSRNYFFILWWKQASK